MLNFLVLAAGALATGFNGTANGTEATNNTSHANGTDTTITSVVSVLTTYCPEPTTFVAGNKTYTVTEPTTLTITDCPCTISAVSPSAGHSNGTSHGNGTNTNGTSPSHSAVPANGAATAAGVGAAAIVGVVALLL